MDNIAIENFINFCDDMQITNEDFKSVVNKVADFVDAFIRKAVSIVQRMILLFKKLKKYSVPNEIRKCIVKVRSSCDALWFKIISAGETEGADFTSELTNIQNSKEYKSLFLLNESFDDDEYVDVPTSAVIKDIQNLNKTLTNTEIAYNKAKRHNTVINQSYWNNIITILQIDIKALNKYFTYGKTENNAAQVIDMPEFEVEIIDS